MDARERRMRERAADAIDARLLDLDDDDPGAAPEGSVAARDRTSDPAGNTAPRQNARLRELPLLLTPLAHVMTEDARDELAGIQPARWRLRVHMHDPEAWQHAIESGSAPDKGEDDELAGYVCIERAVPVAHCVPDVLTWLQQREATGNLVLEWLPPPSSGRKALKHFVNVPANGGREAAGGPPRAPVMKPANGTAGSRDDLLLHTIEVQREESAALRDLVREMQQSQERLIEKLATEQRHTINDLRDGFRETLESDPLRKIGSLVQERVTERVVEDLGGAKKDPFEQLAQQLQKIEDTKSKLGRFFSDPEKRKVVDPLEEKITNALTDVGLLYAKQKLGLPVVSGDKAMDLAKSLAALNSEGDALLKSLDTGEAA